MTIRRERQGLTHSDWEGVGGWPVSPPPTHEKVMTTCTCECELVWKPGLCRYNGIRMRQPAGRLDPDPVTGVPPEDIWMHRHTARGHVTAEAM